MQELFNKADEYYEYASSSYGSPASIFYFLIEGLAIFELYKRKGSEMDKSSFSEYKDISPDQIIDLYKEYISQTVKNNNLVLENRQFSVQRLRQAGFEVIEPSYSINVSFFSPDKRDSYSVFLDLLKERRVSVYPGILSFIFSDSCVRISPNIERGILQEGLDRIINFYGR